MDSSYLYTGNPINPKFSLNIGGQVLEKDKDYDIYITDNVNAGTAKVKIEGKGKFKGTIERTFTIEPVPATSLSFFSDQTEFDFDGTEKEMNITVKFGDVTLTEGTDYTVEYSDNVFPGHASALLTFQGNFSGAMTIDFDIINNLPELENLSEISAERINLGEKVEIRSLASGGYGTYTYAVYYKKQSEKKWFKVHDFTSDEKTVIKPGKIELYNVCIKAQDELGSESKKYFDIEVV